MKRPNLPKNLGMTLLAIWLITYGLLYILSLSIPIIGSIMALFAIVTGGVILFQR